MKETLGEMPESNGGRLQSRRLVKKEFVVPFVLVTSLFFVWGFARAILDVLNKHFQMSMDVTMTRSAMIQATTYIGYFLMAIPAGVFITRRGYRPGVVLGLLLFGIGSLMFIPGEWLGSFDFFLVSLFVIGCGLVVLETAANPYVTELGDSSTAPSRLNLAQSFNGLGCMAATFGVGSFLFGVGGAEGGVAVPYTVMGVVVLLIAVAFSRVRLPEISHEDDGSAADGKGNIARLWKNGMFVFGLSALLAYEVAEISINSYFINFVTGQGWMSDHGASMVITGALAVFMIGRFVGSWIMRRVAAEKMLFWCAVGTVACMLTVLGNFGRVSLVALMCNYMFEAIMFPTIFSLTLRGLGGLTKSASSILMMTPVGGCAFLLMGLVADCVNNIVPFVIPLAGFAVVLAYAFRLVAGRRSR
mgnify:CR=1 FL=1